MLFLVLFAGNWFVSCQEDFENTDVTYPSDFHFGAWASSNTGGKYEYQAVLTKNVDGDTIFYVQRIEKPEGEGDGVATTMFVAKDVVYDDTVGMCTINADESAYGEDIPVTAYATYLKDQQTVALQINANKFYAATVRPTTKMYVDGMWEGGVKNEEGEFTKYFIVQLDPADEEGNLKGVAIFNNEGEDNDGEEITYTFENNVLTVTSTETDHKVTATFNSDYQLVATFGDGVDFVIDPLMGEAPAPVYSFDKPLVGDYTYNVLWSAEKQPDLILTPVEANQFKIGNWCGGVDLTFEWDQDENICKIPMQEVGVKHDTYGDIYICDYGTWGELTGQNIAFDSQYDASSATFNFHVIYFVFTSETTVGQFGHKIETFEITGEAEESARAKLLRKHKKAHQQIDFSKQPTIVPIKK